MKQASDRSGDVPGMKALERAVQVLRILADNPSGLSLSELAKSSGVPMTTLHRILAVLVDASLVGETATGRYVVGVGSVVLARAFLDGVDLRDAARPEMLRLVEATGEACHLGVLASVHIVYLEKVDSRHPVRMYSRVGGTNPALTTAIGRAILAHSSAEVVARVLEDSRRLFGTDLTAPELEDRLLAVREQGFSTDLQENEVGICCVGAPVFDHSGRPVAGLSVSTPAIRFDPSQLSATGARVGDAAARVSAALGWTGARSGGPVARLAAGEQPSAGIDGTRRAQAGLP